MKILWITNTLFPAACVKLGIATPVVGGWMYSAAINLSETIKNTTIGVATLYAGSKLEVFDERGITYFLIPKPTKNYIYPKHLEHYWQEINDQFQPDIVHIHGTEYPHGLAYVNQCGTRNVVVSIQGLVSVIERYYYGGISQKDLKKNITFRDIVKHDTVFMQHNNIKKRGIFEKTLLKKVEHIIGRTSWDKSHVCTINPNINYHFCNETLRNEFYNHNWDLEFCEKYSIFISQAHYPLKGLHQVIKALPLILKSYNTAKIYIAGKDFVKKNDFKHRTGYGRYIRKLIRSNKLDDKIYFNEILPEDRMRKRYLRSHVFICPSSIENSPNSVGEAQLLGVPCVASYVGGIPDLITNGETGLLYRFEEIEMLAVAVCRIFEQPEFASQLSRNGKKLAMKRHSAFENTLALNSIYQKICKR